MSSADLPRHVTEPKSLWWSWTVSCGAGELIGMTAAAGLAAIMNYVVGDPETLAERFAVLLVMVVAGVMEGAAISFFQWRVLRRVFEQLSASAWMIPTIVVAALGWFVGMLQPTFSASSETATASAAHSMPLILTVAALFGLIAGTVFGAAQWMVLRRHAENAWIWIPANAVGWAVAMAIIFVGATTPDESWVIWQVVLLGTATGIAAGLAIGAITGVGLLQIARDKS